VSVELSYVIPAHNSSQVIEDTIESLAKRLADVPAEIIVVENGSSDSTVEILKRIADGWTGPNPTLKVISSAKGMGNALRKGIGASSGKVVVLTADDLPFGFDDLDAVQSIDMTQKIVAIGSKAHPDSEITRSAMRAILSFGYRTLLRLTLGVRTGDPQGTFIVDGQWVRSVAPGLVEQGYLLTTEIAWAAELMRIRPVEVPVRLREARHATRISPVADSLQMARGLVAMRRRRRVLLASLNGSRAADPV
jgi:dolichyl-phosphate beta-glucosyltransferase